MRFIKRHFIVEPANPTPENPEKIRDCILSNLIFGAAFLGLITYSGVIVYNIVAGPLSNSSLNDIVMFFNLKPFKASLGLLSMIGYCFLFTIMGINSFRFLREAIIIARRSKALKAER